MAFCAADHPFHSRCGIIAFLALLYISRALSYSCFKKPDCGLRRSFGVAGWYSFFRSLPWILVALLIVFVLILALLVKRYSFVYERPTMYLLIGIVALLPWADFLISATPFHRTLFDSARNGNLPVLGGFYRGFGMQRFGDIHRGMIMGTTTGGFIIQDMADRLLRCSMARGDIYNQALEIMS